MVIFGLKQSDKGTITDRKNEDDNSLKQLFTTIGVSEVTAKVTYRLKVKDEKDTRPRPLVLVMKDVNERNKLLNAAKKLKGSAFNQVFMAPDLTEAQRTLFKELVALKKQLNEKRSAADLTGYINYTYPIIDEYSW